ncbi:hypothetical protein DBR11_28950 [Pedobacter sp. HMWF019]|uniref:hypothetical protein n=1 Tax=Pedobacter sp. HMWF019 TaxID=2056856 RepID=UPI000D36E4B1|nr:hypothetical protein [Pedobacter sp. HMWF019]PTS91493.1 hypothetical protein DBR11_28950 [Pedobacter sp. HMWF019]
MKSLKTTFLALALIAGVSGAFVTKTANAASNAKQTTYDWIQFDRAGHIIGTFTNKTVAQVIALTGCNSSNQLCASAISGPTLRYN